MMIQRRFIQCDVLPKQLRENGPAVVLEGAFLSDRTTRDFAACTNLS